nr:bifunctional diguanylate cyclase/phosphodiesterase [Propionibacteriales bacterium]
DEFAVLLSGVDSDEANEQAHRLLAAIRRPVCLEDVNLFVTASVGIALVPDHGTDTNLLLQHADVAMYVAKAASSGVEIYRPDDALASHRRLVLAGDLTAAVEEHTFEVWYQPQGDAATGRIVGAEALLRWEHPTYGPVSPPEAVALAERTGVLRRLTNTILEDALRQRAAWSALGHEVNISVNITPLDLSDTGLPDVVSGLLDATGTPAGALTLEITESGVMSDPARCLAVLDVLAAQGVRLSVDDFGIGHSSLAYLERLPVDEVKIDKSFVMRLEREVSDAKVVRATVALAHDLGLLVVAEGVESQVAWMRVAQLGCEFVQGYALARPMPGIETIGWMNNWAATGVGTPTHVESGSPGRPPTSQTPELMP